MSHDVPTDKLVDDYSLDSVPNELRSGYYEFLEVCNTEKCLTGAQWMQWMKSGTGKSSDFYDSQQQQQHK